MKQLFILSILVASTLYNAVGANIIAEIAAGELIDKMTILQIKTERIKDSIKLKNIQTELETLIDTFNQNIAPSPQLADLVDQLYKANETLWVIEDAIREKERQQAFDHDFVKLARNVYLVNDERCRIKREINNLLGSHLVEEKSYAEYKAPQQQTAVLSPEQLINLGDNAVQQKNLVQAISYYQQALATKSEDVNLLNKLAVCYYNQHELDKSVKIFKKVSQLAPTNAEVFKTIGTLSEQLMNIDDAIAAYTASLKLNPLQQEVIGNLGQAHQIKGELEVGWKYWRLYDLLAQEAPMKSKPIWKGENLQGKTILIVDEGGFGDLMNWIRYTTLFKKQGTKVICEIRPSMIPLISLCKDIDCIIAQGKTLPSFDFYIPIGRMHRTFNTTLQTIPAQIPYLFADQKLVNHWKNELARDKKFKIGICWHASYMCNRSMPIAEFAPLAQLEKVSLYSLQQGPGLEQIGQLPTLKTFPASFDQNGAFTDTAAVMKNLDLVITVDTSVAHLAGALGVPVWILLPFNNDWRWFLHRSDSPWYPTARLFRQPIHNDWKTPMQEIIQMLKLLR